LTTPSQSPQLEYIISQFNEGCTHFQVAIQKVQETNFNEFENNLRTGGASIFNSLELAIKDYIKFFLNDPVIANKFCSSSRRVDFYELLQIMETHAKPPLKPDISKKLNFYRNKMRNPTEHEGSIPSVPHMNDAISIIRSFLLAYLPLTESQLINVTISVDVKGVLEPEKNSYFQSICQLNEYMDLGGISPRVGNKVVRIKLDDLFIPLKVEENAPLIESIEEGKSKSLTKKTIKQGSSNSTDSCDENQKKIDFLETELNTQNNLRRITLNQMLEKPKTVLLGHPGSGKTTVGKYIAYSMASKQYSKLGQQFEELIPICVKVSDYALELKSNQSLSLFEFIVKKNTNRFSKLFEWYLKNDLCICIIDGLDEIPLLELQGPTIRKIEQFISEFNNNRFLITSRIVGYRKNQISGDFSQVTLIDFDNEQISHFLKKWHIAIEIESANKYSDVDIDEKVKKLSDSINSNIGIRKLASNPLLLTIIALANWRGTKLPNRRVDLYQIACETLIENWPLRQRQLKLDSNEILKILEPIAYKIFISGKNNLIHEQELRPLFEENVIEQRGISPQEAKTISKDLFDAIEEGTGFFLARGLDERHQKLFGFLHLTFAEYLTARYVAEQWLDGNFDLKKYAHDDRWHEIILLMAGHFSSYSQQTASKLVREILNLGSDFEDVLNRDLLLAAEILIDNVKVKRDLEDEIVSKLIKIGLATKHVPLFRYVIDCVSRISKNFPIGAPIELLKINDLDDMDLKIRKSTIFPFVGKLSEESCRILIQGLFKEDLSSHFSKVFFEKSRMIGMEGKRDHSIIFQSKGNTFFTSISKDVALLFIEAASPNIINFDQFVNKKESEETNPPICFIINTEDMKKIDIEQLESVFEKKNSIFYTIVFNALKGDENQLISINDLLIKILDSISQTDDLNKKGIRLEMLEICSVFSHIFNKKFDSKIELLLHEEARKTIPLLDCENQRFQEIALRFIINICENDREILFNKLIDHNKEIIRAEIIDFIGTTLKTESVKSKIKDHFVADPSQYVRYICARKIIEFDDFNENEVEKLFDTLLQGNPSQNNNSQFPWLLNLIQFSTKLSTKEWYEKDLDSMNNRIFNLILEFDTSSTDFESYRYSRFNSNENLAKLIRPLCVNSNPKVQFLSVLIWSQIRSKETLFTEFIDISKKSENDVKKTAINVLTNIDLKNENILSALFNLIFDSNKTISTMAAERLIKVKNHNQRQKVIERLQQKDNSCFDNPACFLVLWEILVFPHLDKNSNPSSIINFNN
jgi:hypothetical protein